MTLGEVKRRDILRMKHENGYEGCEEEWRESV